MAGKKEAGKKPNGSVGEAAGKKKKEPKRKLTREEREQNRIDDLEYQLTELNTRKESKLQPWVYLTMAVLFGGLAITLYVTVLNYLWLIIVGVSFGSIYLILFIAQWAAAITRDNRIDGIVNELDLLTLPYKSIEERAETLFKGHQLELKKYYDQTRRQSLWILVVGVICIFVGFIIIGGTAYVLFFVQTGIGTEEKIVTAATGLVGAILTNFIGAIYITMYKGAIETLTKFHEKLVTTHHLHFGNFLAAKIKKDTDREATLQKVVETLFKEALQRSRADLNS